ncbi:hypothetical protein [Sulfitobacter sp. HI0023]|uniref:hypothetical protein n=3 Tax=unclassified Sulfitobacter TaxID=196795 RepID=UPI0012371EA5|nr:hypothetical protein [Sulfitobacter sp. HI0023]
MSNMFGRRYFSLKKLRDYAVDLDLCPHPPAEGLMEFLEREGLLTPVRRLRFPDEIPRRLASDRHESVSIAGPIEPDGPRLDAAITLLNGISHWSDARIYGESEHVLDALADEHRPFIQTDFSPAAFTPWQNLSIHLYDTDRGPVYSTAAQDTPAFYHYWQVFWLATILRSGVHLWFPLDDQALYTEVLSGGAVSCEGLRRRSQQSINLEAYQELQSLREYQAHFEAVGYFEAYTHNALQTFQSDRDENGRIPARPWQRYLRREREIAQDTLSRSDLGEGALVEFIGKQCEWWDNARRVGPSALSNEYKRNIRSTIMLVRAATGIDSQDVVQRVGRRTGHFRPTLEVIFPDWTEEQRDLTVRSLKHWADESLASLPNPFPVSEAELNGFCDWLEERGLYQYYWHFRRLVDLQNRDDPVHRAASSAEVVGFATLCEMIANEVLRDQGREPRGDTLPRKLKKIFNTNGPVDLGAMFDRYYALTNTNRQSLPRRLAQIARINAGGPHSPVLRALLSLWVIRNEGAHLGLLQFDPARIVEMIRILSLASLMLWKAR